MKNSSMDSKNLNDKIMWAVTDKARNTVQRLVKMGMDADLALNILERIWPESWVYNLPDEDGEE
jgi:hypothetical protein